MDLSPIISSYRDAKQEDDLSHVRAYFSFNPVGPLGDGGLDVNLEFRTALTQALLNDFSLADIRLIRDMIREEIDCERAIWRHDNLYQLSFYLYSLGQIGDTFLLYEAKYGTGHMDASTMQDQYSISLGHDPDKVIEYVKARFAQNPNLKDNYPDLIQQLESIRDDREYGTIAEYSTFIRGYFFGHGENESSESEQLTPVISPRRPWWKFW
jgi:hypothetical protein